MVTTTERTDTAERKTGNGRPRRGAGDILDRQPPFDLEAESAVLGSMILTLDCADDVQMVTSPEDFYDDSNRVLCRELFALRNEGKPCDMTILIDRLKKAGAFEAAGGAAYLYKVSQSVPNAAHAVYYARIVRAHADRRGLIQVCSDTLRDAYDLHGGDVESLLDRTEEKTLSVRNRHGGDAPETLSDVVTGRLQELDRRLAGEEADVTPTGFSDLDSMLAGGIRPQQLVIVGACPGMGKTAIASQIACHVAGVVGKRVLFSSLEMSAEQLADRQLSVLSGVNGYRMRAGTMTNEDRKKIVEAAAEMSRYNMQIDDDGMQRVGQIAAQSRRLGPKRREHAELIVIDYLQLIESDDTKVNREQQVSTVTKRLKALAKERNCPVLCLAQLNRQAASSKDMRPRLSHLRESGQIEQSADVVLLLHREEYYFTSNTPDDIRDKYAGLAEVIVAKHRDGPTGTVELHWDAKHTRFQTLAPKRHKEFDDYNEGTRLPHADDELE